MTLILFTDLDGTLLDHDTYSYAAAKPALAALADREIPVVLASSKTRVEMAPLHAALELGNAPFIVENGAGIVWPEEGASTDDSAYLRIIAALNTIPGELRAQFRGFGDMSAEDVAHVTGLSPDASARAKTRQFSEPGIWSGDAAARETFIETLKERGIVTRQGGRFLTLTEGGDKAIAMRQIAQTLGGTMTLALGDAPNDIGMLTNADHGVIVRNDHGAPIPRQPGEDAGRIDRTALPGPAGWNAAVLCFLNTLKTPT